MASLYHTLARSQHPAVRSLRRLYWAIFTFTLPAPKLIVKPMLWVFETLRLIYYLIKRVLICEPLFKASCRSYGRGVRTGVFIHWIHGKGDIILGDRVVVDGLCNFLFASRFSECPTLEIGSDSGVGHMCSFSIAKRITIGKNCRIAGAVWMFDSSGHPSNPAARLAGLPPTDEEVRPITIEDNVWIGGHCIIFPGVTIGEGSIVSAGSVVISDVPQYTVVAGYPARRVSKLENGSGSDAPPGQVPSPHSAANTPG